MAFAHEASHYLKLPDGRVHCTLCPIDCRIVPGSRGACAVRYNEGGTLYTLVYDAIAARNVEPVEKKPLFHFLPGSLAYSIATVGCNLQCQYCQNWQISQWPRTHLARRLERGRDAASKNGPALDALARRVPGTSMTPEQMVQDALASGARSIAYTFTEPTVFVELAYDTAVRARAAGLKNIFVTSAFINEAPLRHIAAVLDAANIDLKFFREDSYRRVSRARLQPVLDAIRLYHALGVWVEITTLVIPGLNDSDQELRDIARFVHSVGAEVPWHVSQFYPDYQMLDRPVTPVETLHRARRIGLECGLTYVYEGNVPGFGAEQTTCPVCHTVLIERIGMSVQATRIRDHRCPACGTWIDGVFE